MDLEISDLEAAQQQAIDAGATLMDWQPQKEGVRILADLAGTSSASFCLVGNRAVEHRTEPQRRSLGTGDVGLVYLGAVTEG